MTVDRTRPCASTIARTSRLQTSNTIHPTRSHASKRVPMFRESTPGTCRGVSTVTPPPHQASLACAGIVRTTTCCKRLPRRAMWTTAPAGGTWLARPSGASAARVLAHRAHESAHRARRPRLAHRARVLAHWARVERNERSSAAMCPVGPNERSCECDCEIA